VESQRTRNHILLRAIVVLCYRAVLLCQDWWHYLIIAFVIPSVSRITHKCVSGCWPNMVVMGKGRPSRSD